MKKHHKKGFTLVELTIAMSFLAVLLITIAILVIRIIGIYQNGLSIRAVSATGRQLVDDFTRSISGSPIVSVGYDPVADANITSNINRDDRLTYKYYFQKLDTVEVNGEPRANTPVAGAFCTGLYTYLWNTGYDLQAAQSDAYPYDGGFTYEYGPKEDRKILEDFKLIRIPDSGRSVCIEQRTGTDGKIDPRKNKFKAPAGQELIEPIELLTSDGDELALYDLRVFPASTNRITGHVFYSATFILATIRGGVDIFTNGDFCTEEYSTTLSTDSSYCAINKFNFAMRATGETTGNPSYGENVRR